MPAEIVPVIGAMYGNLKILGAADPIEGKRAYLVECQCEGKPRFAARWDMLRKGKRTSCGCRRSYKPAKELEPGTVFGKLTVLRRDGKIGASNAYLCRCECGREKRIRSSTLRNGATKTCDECRGVHPGDRYGDLIVMEVGDREQTDFGTVVRWRCICVGCDGGNEAFVRATDLRSGSSSSCGCYHRHRAREAGLDRHTGIAPGTMFGYLRVVSDTRTARNGNRMYLVDCTYKECTRKNILVAACNLRSGGSTSCGCFQAEDFGGRFRTHGKSGTHEYRVFRDNLRRERKEFLQEHLTWTIEMEALLFQVQTACVLCGTTKDLHTDHVRPLSKGNGLKPGNACRLCRPHNLWKAAKDLEDLPELDRQLITEAAETFRLIWDKYSPALPALPD